MEKLQTRKIVLTKEQEVNIKKWKKRMENAYNIEMLINNFIAYFESVGKNFFKYMDNISFEKDLKHYNKLRDDFLEKKSRLQDMIIEYHYSSSISAMNFEIKYYSYFETQMEIIENVNALMPKIMEHCKNSKAGW